CRAPPARGRFWPRKRPVAWPPADRAARPADSSRTRFRNSPHVRTQQELSMDLSTSTVLVTGANRGLGRALAAELLSRGATVYAGARNPDKVDLPGAKPIALDITDPGSVAAAAQATGDVTVLINNAGIGTTTDL